MKVMFGEYGKVIVLAIVFCALLPFLFGKGTHELLGLISTASPKETVGREDAFTLAKAILVRKSPTLHVKPYKLYFGEMYDLLDKDTLVIKAENEEGETVSVSIVSVIDPEMQDITAEVDPTKFVPQKRGRYRVMYEASEVYQGSKKTLKKEYGFLVD